MARKNIKDFPEEFVTSEHTYEWTEGEDGRVYIFQDGRFSNSRSFKNAFYHAFVEIELPDGTVATVKRDVASEAGMVAHEPREGESFVVEDVDGNLYEIDEAEFSGHVGRLYDEGIEPIRYPTGR